MKIYADAILTHFCLRAQPPRERRGSSRRGVAARRGEPSNYVYTLRPRITCVDREVIREYFRERGDDADALATAAPGARDQRLLELPAALDEKLSRLPDGFERLWKGRDLLVIETRTGRVIDFMRAVRPAN